VYRNARFAPKGLYHGKSVVEPVRSYIANQEEHHRIATSQDELRRLLAEYDERYVWD
jgi:hypothetical protein